MINCKWEYKGIHIIKCIIGLHIQCQEFLNSKIVKTSNHNTGIAVFHMKSIQKIQNIYLEKDL